MSKKSGTVDREKTQDKQGQPSREEINSALERLEKIAENLPPVDVVAILREGRDVGSNRIR